MRSRVVKSGALAAHPFDTIQFPPLPPKPRQRAVTSVLDKGLGLAEATDLVRAAGTWIDVVKLGWASARLTDGEVLREKVAMYQRAGIRVCTGGTFLEIALAQERVEPYLAAARALGIDMVEVSNGIHPMSDDDKSELIRRTAGAGFTVWSEVGKKDEDEDARLSIEDRIAAVERELEAGSEKVVLEARESGTIGIYDRDGKPATELIDRIAEHVGIERLVFEAPQKSQQVWMIRHFGADVNLGNVAANEAISLATLRTGLRGDTFADFHLRGVDVFSGLGVNGALEARKRGGIVIMIDALRASSTIVTALASGMASVKVVGNAADCVGDVTAGERGGKKLAHCDHGNSPGELLREDYTGRQLVLTTTNGAEVLLTASGDSTTVLVGSALNASAVAEAAVAMATARSVPITLLEAGRNTLRAQEDALVAGEIFHAMRGAHLHGKSLPSSRGLESEFFASESGKNLVSLGYDDDVRFCAQRDVYDIVPIYTGGVVTRRTVSE